MSFLESIIAGAEFRSGLANPSGWLVNALGGSRSSSGQRVSVNSALGLAPVFAATTMISEAVGRIPLKVYKMLDAVDDERTEARTHRAWSMLHDKPNSAMPANRFWATVTAHLLLWGNAFIPLERSPQSGLVEELRLADPASMNVEWNANTLVKNYYVDTVEGRKRWSDEDMLHIVAWSLDGIIGQSRIAWCRNMLGAAIARDKFEGGFWDRGAIFSGVIEHPDQLGKEGVDNLKYSFSAAYGGAAERGHQTPVLEEGATFRPLTMPLADMQFVENAQLSRTDIAVMFNLPPAYLGGSTGDSLTYATVESNQIQFVQHAVMPYTDTIAKAVTADPGIFPQNVYFAEFVTEALLKADKVTQATYYEKLFALIDNEGRRVLGTNEIRGRENLPPAIPEKKPEPPPAPAGDVPAEMQANADAMKALGNGKPAQMALPMPNQN